MVRYKSSAELRTKTHVDGMGMLSSVYDVREEGQRRSSSLAWAGSYNS
jgi:hypothetical protein